jgi:hypothetical protein
MALQCIAFSVDPTAARSAHEVALALTGVTDNVLGHLELDLRRTPHRRAPEAWADALADELNIAAGDLDDDGRVAGAVETSKHLAQLAALCIRAIDELRLPLVPAAFPSLK